MHLRAHTNKQCEVICCQSRSPFKSALSRHCECSEGMRYMHAEPSGEGRSSEGRLERWLEAVANEPSPEGDDSFGDDEGIPGGELPSGENCQPGSQKSAPTLLKILTTWIFDLSMDTFGNFKELASAVPSTSKPRILFGLQCFEACPQKDQQVWSGQDDDCSKY